VLVELVPALLEVASGVVLFQRPLQEYLCSSFPSHLYPQDHKMSRNVSTESIKSRHSAPQSAKSFTRYEPAQSSPISASTAQPIASVASPKKEDRPLAPPRKAKPEDYGDVFEKTLEEDEEPLSPDLGRSQSLPERFGELPIELMSLTDRYVQ